MLRFTDDQIGEALEAAATDLGDGRRLLDVLKPPAGPYALLHHLGHAAERVRDIGILVRRLLVGRERLSALNGRINVLRPDDWPAGMPYPDELSRLMTEALSETQSMRIDYESLFHFGSVLLDQWAYAMGYLSGVNAPNEFDFHGLVLQIERADAPASLQPVRAQLLGRARWLHFWMRSYRNGFVVHADRPIQRGTVAAAVGSEFKLFTPSPPGWENDAALDAAIEALLPHAPQWLQGEDPSYWERARPRALLERIVENVGNLGRQADRDLIANLARRKGLGTPTFQIVASVLADFVRRGTPLVRDAAISSPAAINLGARQL